MSRFTEILTVSPLADGRTWVTRRDFGYDVGEKDSGNSIDVPIGFMTDFASVPRPLWWLFPRWGKYGNAAIIHDWCYWEQKRDKEESDRIFREAMEVLNVPGWKALILYYSVKLGGGRAWRGNKQRKENGITKVAPIMPEKSIDTPVSLRARQ